MRIILSFITLICMTAIAYTQSCADPIIANGECTPTLTFPTTVTWVVNPNSAGINTTTNVGQYADDGTNGWDNLLLDYGAAIDLSTNNYLHMDIYTPAKSAQVLAKLEGGSSAANEVWSPYSISTTDWVHFVFDFSGQATESHNKLALFFDASQTGGANPTNYYFDNLQWASSATLSAEEIAKNSKIELYKTSLSSYQVKAAAVISSYQLNDISGRKLLSKHVGGSQFNVDLSSYTSGLYLLNVKTSRGSQTFKLIK